MTGMTQPLGPSDGDAVVGSAIATLTDADLDWSATAGSLDWTRWELLGHMADDLFGYAAQLGAPGITGYVPFLLSSVRAGAPNETIHVADDAGVDGAMQVLRSTGAMLSVAHLAVGNGSRRTRRLATSRKLALVRRLAPPHRTTGRRNRENLRPFARDHGGRVSDHGSC